MATSDDKAPLRPRAPVSSWDALILLSMFVSIALMTRMGAFPRYFQAVIVGSAITGGGFGMWLYFRSLKADMIRRHWVEKVFVFLAATVACATVAPFLTIGLPESINNATKRSVAKELAAFKADKVDGYPAFKAAALRDFNIAVTLADEQQTWLKTLLADSGSASPASVDQGPGFCELSYLPSSLQKSFPIEDPALRKYWVKGVLTHELGHCVDAQRDFVTASSDHKASAFSIAPAAQSSVKDVFGYAAASARSDTKLWKEAFADVFAIGWWKLAAPAGQWKPLSDAMLAKRLDAQTRDKDHATSCWIRIAQRTAQPSSMAGLPAWADAIRSDGGCRAKLNP